MDQIFSAENLIALLTLTALEIVLGIDNIVFISILSSRLPDQQEPAARRTGLAAALITRVLLLFSLSWLIGLDKPLFHVLTFEVTGHDLILGAGGLFLIYKATREIHDRLEGEEVGKQGSAVPSFAGVIVQIALMDIIFSLDSVITAVGMANVIWVMILAVVIAIGIMMLFADPIAGFVEKHPTVKMLALSFLLMIGFSLVVESFHVEIPKGYIYFAMGFSVLVEVLNLAAARRRVKPVELHGPIKPPSEIRSHKTE